MLDYSVIIPCYKSKKIIPELIRQLVEFFENENKSFEIICVDDSSPDGLYDALKNIRQNDNRIKIIQHFANYGQQNALITGFKFAQGKYVITMDDDLQNPPTEIKKLIEAIHEDKYDVVIGYPDCKKHKAYRNLGTQMVRAILRYTYELPKDFRSSSFRIMHRSVAEKIADIRTSYPFVTAMILQLTKKIGTVRVEHHNRCEGKSNFNLKKCATLALLLILNYTRLPLKIISGSGFLISIMSFIYAGYIVINSITNNHYESGWPSVIVAITFFGGLNLLALSVIGEYLIRILNENTRSSESLIRNTEI